MLFTFVVFYLTIHRIHSIYCLEGLLKRNVFRSQRLGLGGGKAVRGKQRYIVISLGDRGESNFTYVDERSVQRERYLGVFL